MKKSNRTQALPPQSAEADQTERMRTTRTVEAMHQARVLRFFPDKGPLRFILLENKEGEVIADLGDKLAERSFELAWKMPASLRPLVKGLMRLMVLPVEAYANQNGMALVKMARSDNGLPSKLMDASLALELLVQHLGGPIGSMLDLPIGGARNSAAEDLKKRLCAAVDALNHQSQSKTHAKKTTITVPLGDGTSAKMPLAAGAIKEARQFVARERREPTKAELRRGLESKYAAEFREVKAADSFWTKVWDESGLEGLEEDTPYRTTRKAC